MSDCNSNLSFTEKELCILRNTIDKAERKRGKKIVNDPNIKKIIDIVEKFLRDKKLICYGGTAINNILPVHDQFYDKDIEIPDYDFYSTQPIEDAKKLADIYYKAGFDEVEAKAGVHHGTYKVYVNFIPVADITFLEKGIFNRIKKDAIHVNGILYCPPNFLRMNMYLELSRPQGDISRWEKVLKRLILLNKNYPLDISDCTPSLFQRQFDKNEIETEKNIYNIAKDTFIDQDVVFFGGYASSLYSKYMPKKVRKLFHKIPDFDVLSMDPKKVSTILKEQLMYYGYKHVSIKKHSSIGEIINIHYEIIVKTDGIDETIAFIYEPLACHSYNTLKINKKIVKVATIDTMLSYYFAFYYSDRPYYDCKRILCMSEYLFKVQQKNRLEQKGLLKRFSINCYGKQETLEDMRGEKATKYKELKDKKDTKEYESWFLRYIPYEEHENKEKERKSSKNKTSKKSKKQSKTKKNKKNAFDKIVDTLREI